MGTKQILVYADTGEVCEKGERFFMVYTRHNFMLDRRLTLTDIRVLAMLGNVMLKDGHVIDSQASIAKRLEITATHLSRSLKHLRECDYLEHSQYRGRRCLRVNPAFVSKRSSQQWKNEQSCE